MNRIHTLTSVCGIPWTTSFDRPRASCMDQCVVNPICDRIRVVVRTRTIVRLTSGIGRPSDITWFRTRPVLATCACQHESESTHPHRQEQWFSATNVQWNIGRRARGCCNVTTSPHSILSPLLWLAVVQPEYRCNIICKLLYGYTFLHRTHCF